ncbi:hypothetical protein R3P38DRAFT_326559 [Favolaschia claudopus]|uniref:Uncharacterized protein n=1 Tax=Favolaschia claudopus TaxID=2862362 RepID=A0AAW0CWE4_9AGAR
MTLQAQPMALNAADGFHSPYHFSLLSASPLHNPRVLAPRRAAPLIHCTPAAILARDILVFTRDRVSKVLHPPRHRLPPRTGRMLPFSTPRRRPLPRATLAIVPPTSSCSSFLAGRWCWRSSRCRRVVRVAQDTAGTREMRSKRNVKRLALSRGFPTTPSPTEAVHPPRGIHGLPTLRRHHHRPRCRFCSTMMSGVRGTLRGGRGCGGKEGSGGSGGGGG